MNKFFREDFMATKTPHTPPTKTPPDQPTEITLDQLPDESLVRGELIYGDPKAKPPKPGVLPISRSTWWAGVKAGRFPQPVKLGPRITAWKTSEIRALIDSGIVQ